MADTGTSEPPQLHEPTYLHCLFLSITYIYLSAYPTGSVSQENPNIVASLERPSRTRSNHEHLPPYP